MQVAAGTCTQSPPEERLEDPPVKSPRTSRAAASVLRSHEA